jgi:hypothetical protein
MKFLPLGLIRLYQYTLSPDHGPLRYWYGERFCRFHPSCSEYTYQAIDKHGLIKGGYLGLWRIVRCNPWSVGGNDPVG